MTTDGTSVSDTNDNDTDDECADSTGIICKLGSRNCVPVSWVLLDNQSTVDVFSDLLNNIRQSHTSMTIHCNAGSSVTKQVGDFNDYGTVLYYPDGIANIISLSLLVDRGYAVTYNSDNGNEFLVSKDGELI
jgi:sRNA-binding regulator protein Hfq